MGYANPLYTYGGAPSVPLSDFVGAGSFWKGAAVFQFYWLCFAIILAVHRPPAVAARHRSRAEEPARAHAAPGERARTRRSSALPPSRWPPPAPTPITTSRSSTATRPATRPRSSRPTTSANISSTRSCRSRRSPHVALDVQLYPKQRLLRHRRPLRPRQQDQRADQRDPRPQGRRRTLEFLKLDVAGAQLVSDDKKFGYRIYRFDKPLAPGATTVADLQVAALAARLPRLQPGDRRHRERHVRQQQRVRADRSA